MPDLFKGISTLAIIQHEEDERSKKAVHDAAIYDIRVLPENESDQSGLY